MNLIQELVPTGGRNAEKLGSYKNRLSTVESLCRREAGGVKREGGTGHLAVAGTTAGLFCAVRPSQERGEHFLISLSHPPVLPVPPIGQTQLEVS